jgi:hypothetical protein
LVLNPKRRGLDRHDVSDVSHEFGIKHRPHCREHNPGGGSHMNGCPDGVFPERETWAGGYHCLCDFWERIEAAIISAAFGDM